MPDFRIYPATATLSTTGSANMIGSGSTTNPTIFSVNGNNGRLLEVTDDLSDSIFSANTIAGLPVIEAFANNCVVLGQYSGNQLRVTCTSIAGGKCNTATGDYSFIGGGCCNTAPGIQSTISGGYYNSACGCASFIGGGQTNQAYGRCAAAVGGYGSVSNVEASFVGGGWNNWVYGAANHSSIVGGYQNCAIGPYSAILGGYYNCINGHTAAFIIGQELVSSANCTTYTRALSKTSGTFRIDHPDPAKTATKYLQHSFVESPTRGDNIYRYGVTTCSGSASFALPDYYKFLNENDQIFIAPKNHFGTAYGTIDSCQSCVSVCSNCDGDYNVLIIGTRKDIDAKNGFLGVEIWK